MNEKTLALESLKEVAHILIRPELVDGGLNEQNVASLNQAYDIIDDVISDLEETKAANAEVEK
jgi:hypothetical protein